MTQQPPTQIHSLLTLKKAKQYLIDFQNIRRILNITAMGLGEYSSYKLANHLLILLAGTQKTLNHNIFICENIIKNKGNVTHESFVEKTSKEPS